MYEEEELVALWLFVGAGVYLAGLATGACLVLVFS